MPPRPRGGTLGGLRTDGGLADATLDTLLAHDTGGSAKAAGAYGDTATARQSSQRLSRAAHGAGSGQGSGFGSARHDAWR